MRQTSLTSQEILTELDDPSSKEKRCFLLNEAGVILWDGGEGAKDIENYLGGLLSSDNLKDKCYAFGYLSTTKNLDMETLAKLAGFTSDPANQEIIATAKDAISHPRMGQLG